jgi:hypothetical protein
MRRKTVLQGRREAGVACAVDAGITHLRLLCRLPAQPLPTPGRSLCYAPWPHKPRSEQPTTPAIVLRLGVGIRFKPTFWFGYFGGKKNRFW